MFMGVCLGARGVKSEEFPKLLLQFPRYEVRYYVEKSSVNLFFTIPSSSIYLTNDLGIGSKLIDYPLSAHPTLNIQKAQTIS